MNQPGKHHFKVILFCFHCEAFLVKNHASICSFNVLSLGERAEIPVSEHNSESSFYGESLKIKKASFFVCYKSHDVAIKVTQCPNR